MLELDDIQHILLARAPALAARYEFLSFRNPSAGQEVAHGYPADGAVGRRGSLLGRRRTSVG